MSESYYVVYEGKRYCITEAEQRFMEGLSSEGRMAWIQGHAETRESLKKSAASVEPKVADSVSATLAQRGSRYGDFTDHARLCQGLMSEMICFNPREQPASALSPWEKLDPVKKQALTVIMDKIARILSGDPNYDDNWHDIQGYAKLVEDRLPKKGEDK